MSKPGKVLKGLCKKLGVRLTVKRGKKRVYKSIAVLKRQCKSKKKKKKVKKKVKRRRRRKFGGQDISQEFLLEDLREEQSIFLDQLYENATEENPLTSNYIRRELMTTFKDAFKAKHRLSDSDFYKLMGLLNQQLREEGRRKRQEERLQRKRDKNAMKIQALFRGKNTRRRLKELKKEEERKRQEEIKRIQEEQERKAARQVRQEAFRQEALRQAAEEEAELKAYYEALIQAAKDKRELRRQKEEYANMGFFTGLARGDAPTIAKAVAVGGILGTAAVGKHLYNIQQKKKRRKVKKKKKSKK